MRLGILGLQGSGKTTLFNALTGMDIPTGVMLSGGRFEVHTAVVDVPDSRLDALSDLLKPRKTTYAKVSYVDVDGLRVESGHKGIPGQLVNHLEQMDGLLHVVRAFDDPTVHHPLGAVDPERDLGVVESEILLHDMLTVERRLERLMEERQKGGRDRAVIEREIDLFESLGEALNQERPIRSLSLSDTEEELISGFGLLTRKPILVVINLAESSQAPEIQMEGENVDVISMHAGLEMEIAQLPAEDMKAFLEEYGIEQAGREKVVRASYDLLRLQSFFTINEREARAWTLPYGATALEAAGTVHSDMARGFIRAEVIASDELLSLGGLAEARAQGKLRLEGRDYVLNDGEVLYIRFNV